MHLAVISAKPRAYMCPLSVALFERFTVCSAKMAEPIDGKASNRLRYTLSVTDVCNIRNIFVATATNSTSHTSVCSLLACIGLARVGTVTDKQ